MLKMCDKTITIYCSYVDELTRSNSYRKYVIDKCFISESNSSQADTTGEKNSNLGKMLIPYINKYFDNYIEPNNYVGQIGKWTLKKGDYIVKGNGEDFSTLENLKSNNDVYEIKTINFNLYGTEPHIYIEVI